MTPSQDLPDADTAPAAPVPAKVALARRGEPILLQPDMSLAAAFEVIAANCLNQLRDNTPGVVAGDAESVHQMRVGLRRLRCLMRMLARRIEQPDTLTQETEWLSQALGAARDDYVLASTTIPGLACATQEPPQWRALHRAARANARASTRVASALVSSGRFVRLLELLDAWLTSAIRRPDIDVRIRRKLARPAKPHADSVLARLHRKLLAAAKKLRQGSDEDRHRVRIAAKRLRYTAEFFQSMYRPKRSRRFIERLAMLQECLGSYNDAVVADAQLRRLPGNSLATARDTEAARRRLADSVDSIREDLRRHWKGFRATKPL